ncbi:hypothetical protein N7520_001732 [Penicillium odoratum]|uniref:uncharacterized protein n=1 Tax=Penicillium odoratum TaxID=1167516 RepID=UPI002546596C|nr:uncharacterized protein N7520_001732 [Penicillium odoratum]KAJ5778486.1 hypothetical protein N7520_001732 [Penicillium odoratum]
MFPERQNFGTGIPAARAICIATASSMLVRSVHFKTNPNGGIPGVVSHIVDSIGRGQVKSGRKKDGTHVRYIAVSREGSLALSSIASLT